MKTEIPEEVKKYLDEHPELTKRQVGTWLLAVALLETENENCD